MFSGEYSVKKGQRQQQQKAPALISPPPPPPCPRWKFQLLFGRCTIAQHIPLTHSPGLASPLADGGSIIALSSFTDRRSRDWAGVSSAADDVGDKSAAHKENLEK